MIRMWTLSARLWLALFYLLSLSRNSAVATNEVEVLDNPSGEGTHEIKKRATFRPLVYSACPRCPKARVTKYTQPITAAVSTNNKARPAVTRYMVVPYNQWRYRKTKTVTFKEYISRTKLKTTYTRVIVPRTSTSKTVSVGTPFVTTANVFVARPTKLVLNDGRKFVTVKVNNAPTWVRYRRTTSRRYTRTVTITTIVTVGPTKVTKTATRTVTASAPTISRLSNAPTGTKLRFVIKSGGAFQGHVVVAAGSAIAVVADATSATVFTINALGEVTDTNGNILYFMPPTSTSKRGLIEIILQKRQASATSQRSPLQLTKPPPAGAIRAKVNLNDEDIVFGDGYTSLICGTAVYVIKGTSGSDGCTQVSFNNRLPGPPNDLGNGSFEGATIDPWAVEANGTAQWALASDRFHSPNKSFKVTISPDLGANQRRAMSHVPPWKFHRGHGIEYTQPWRSHRGHGGGHKHKHHKRKSISTGVDKLTLKQKAKRKPKKRQVAPGQSPYTISFWYFIDNASENCNIVLFHKLDRSDDGFLVPAVAPNLGSWKQASYVFYPDGDVVADFQYFCNPAPLQPVSFWVDDVRAFEGGSVSPSPSSTLPASTTPEPEPFPTDDDDDDPTSTIIRSTLTTSEKCLGTPQATTNLVINGGFELYPDSLSPWSPGRKNKDTLQHSEDNPHSGLYNAEIDISAGSIDTMIGSLDRSRGLCIGRPYYVTLQVAASRPKTACTVDIMFHDTTGICSTTYSNVDTTYSEFSCVMYTRYTYPQLVVKFDCSKESTPVTMFLDDVYINDVQPISVPPKIPCISTGVVNGCFERAAISPWTSTSLGVAGASGNLDTTISRAGDQSFKMSVTRAGMSQALSQSGVAGQQGKKYAILVWYQFNKPDSTCSIAIVVAGVTKRVAADSEKVGVWTRYDNTYTSADTDSISITLSCTSAQSAGVTVFIDQVSVKPL